MCRSSLSESLPTAFSRLLKFMASHKPASVTGWPLVFRFQPFPNMKRNRTMIHQAPPPHPSPLPFLVAICSASPRPTPMVSSAMIGSFRFRGESECA